MAYRTMFVLTVVVCLINGCCAGPEAAKPVPPKVEAPLSKSDQLRQKAKIAEAASLVGYDGKAIKRDLNKIIDQQEESAKRLDELDNF